MTSVNLKIKGKDNSVTMKQFDIEEADFFQLTRGIKIVMEVIGKVQESEELRNAFADITGTKPIPVIEDMPEHIKQASEEEQDKFLEEERRRLAAEQDAEFFKNLFGSFEILALYLPEKATELLSALSGIDREIVEHQKGAKVFDIYDAILDENDIEKLWERIKKSLEKTKQKAGFLNLRKKATQQ